MANFNIIYGKRSCIEALRSGVPIRKAYIASSIERDSLVEGILRKARKSGIDVKETSRRRLDELCGKAKCNHQGVALEAEAYHYASIREILDAADGAGGRGEGSHGKALVVVCDHVTDSGNLGAIARSAESVGAAGMIIPNRRSAQVTPATYKASAGAIAYMKVAMVPNLKSAIGKLKDAGFWIVAAEERAEGLLWDTDLRGRIAIVAGSENDGISDLVLKNCDILCRLPQKGSIGSLNVAQASTVFMYEWLRQNVG